MIAKANSILPGAVELVSQAHALKVTMKDFKQWVRDKLLQMQPGTPLMGHPGTIDVLVAVLFLIAVSYYHATAMAETPEALQRLLSHLGSPQMVWDMAKTSAPANGVSVVDAVFAQAERKAERKAERQAATR